jgi:hypothetical protein
MDDQRFRELVAFEALQADDASAMHRLTGRGVSLQKGDSIPMGRKYLGGPGAGWSSADDRDVEVCQGSRDGCLLVVWQGFAPGTGNGTWRAV